MARELFNAVYYNNLPKVKFILENNIFTGKPTNKILAFALSEGYLEIAEYLIAHGANLSKVRDRAFVAAVRYGRYAAIKYLVEHGAKVYKYSDEALENALHSHKRLSITRFLFSIYMADRRYISQTFIASILLNERRYIKMHIKYNIQIMYASRYHIDINLNLSKQIIRNYSLLTDIKLADSPAVYKNVKPGNWPINHPGRLHKLRRRFAPESTMK